MGQLDFDALGAPSGPARHAIFLLDRGLKIRWASEAGCRLACLAWGRVPRIGDSMLDFAVAEAMGDFQSAVDRAFAGKASFVRRKLAYPNGIEILFDVFYDPVHDADGEVELITFSAIDVSDDVRRADVVRLLAAGLAQTADGVLIALATDPLPIVYANEAAVRITGYTRAELVGRDLLFLRGTDLEQPGLTEVAAAVREGRAGVASLRNYRKNGELFYNEFSLSPIRSPTGLVTHYIGVQRDMTARRNLEERLSASERMEALGRLASGVAHDINNLLMSVLVNVGLLQSDDQNEHRSASELCEIEATIARASSLTNQLLLFARTRLTEPVVLDVARHCNEMRRLLVSLLPADVRFDLQSDGHPLPVRIDPAHLEQLVVNLVVNGRDALSSGGSLSVSARAAASGPDLGPCVVIEVRDTGAGMPEAVLGRAFEPFFTTKPGDKGTGLGLATCYGIAKQYGGHIALESSPGAGTTCTVWLPRSTDERIAEVLPQSSDARTGHERSEPAPSRPYRVLLVEDDDRLRNPLARSLRRFGYDVLAVADGASALDVLRTMPIDALVTDVVLPTIGGSEVASVCHELYPAAPQIFATGYAGADLARRGVPAHAVIMEKPFTAKKLAEKLEELLAVAGHRGAATEEPKVD